MLRASIEVDAGDKGGNKTDVSPAFLWTCVHVEGAQPRNRKAGNKLCNYVL